MQSESIAIGSDVIMKSKSFRTRKESKIDQIAKRRVFFRFLQGNFLAFSQVTKALGDKSKATGQDLTKI